LWHITQAMLRWMAPFLSFTAEEAWSVLGAAGKTPKTTAESIFLETFLSLPPADDALLARWSRIREIRDVVNKEIEALRAAGQVGSSLQAEVQLTVAPDDMSLLQALGDDLKFVFITSAITLQAGDELAVGVQPSAATKCERCWHYRADVGHDAAHPGLCGRCTSNLFGAGEQRSHA
jgi:isoleucyl-tRNA synthetase